MRLPGANVCRWGMSSGRVGPGPVEAHVLARTAGPIPREPEGVRPVRRRFAVRGDCTGADLGAARIVHLYALAGRGRRSAERFRCGRDTARDLRAPRREIVVHVEVDARELQSAHVADEAGERAGPTTGAAPEDHLQRLALTLVGALVDEDRHRHLRLALPDVAPEETEGHHVQAVEPHVAVAAGSDMPREDALAGIVRRRLRERAGTGDAAAARVEPVAGDTPSWDVVHEVLQARHR